jgi:hypothetical protein
VNNNQNKEKKMGRRRTEINVSTGAGTRYSSEQPTVTTSTEKQYFEKVK